MDAQVLLLVGMMGTGKSTVGPLVAQRLGLDYWDNDSLVEQLAGAAKLQLLETRGVEKLRRFEKEALQLALAGSGLVAGVAGGALLDSENLERVQEARQESRGLVVWLRATPGVLAQRLGNDLDGRPWLDGDLLHQVTELARVRQPGYALVADLVCDGGLGDAREVAQRIATWCHDR